MCKNIFTYLICICTFMCMANTVYSQALLGGEHPAIQEARVGLVDEFLKRFNGETSHPNISLQDSCYRKSNILFLIEPPKNIENKDSLYNEAVKFVDAIIKSSIRLNYSDTTWIAHATCKGLLDGKKVTFDLYLNVECRKEDMYKWVISRVDGECFDATPRDTIDNIMLYPDDHEIRFISLGRMTKEQPFNVSRFMSKGFEYDPTSAFVYLVKSGKLIIEYVDELEFIFTQIPGYVFSIKYFEREFGKLGWLINRFENISTKEKINLLQRLNIDCIEQISEKEKESVDATTLNEELISETDSIACSAVNNIEKIFLLRIAERKILVKDYMSLLKEADKTVDIEYYHKKIMNLFDENSSVFLYSLSKNRTIKISIADFLKRISSRKLDIISMDRITVPVWDDALINTDGCNEILLKTKIDLFIDDSSNKSEESEQIVVARREQTEDGIEWMPFFGCLYITIK